MISTVLRQSHRRCSGSQEQEPWPSSRLGVLSTESQRNESEPGRGHSRQRRLRDKSTEVYSNGEGDGTPLQYSCLKNPMDGGAWKAAIHAVAAGWIRLSISTFPSHSHRLEKEMATHSSVLVWRIPQMGKPGRLPSLGLHRVGHD